jgi:hypothetical protein
MLMYFAKFCPITVFALLVTFSLSTPTKADLLSSALKGAGKVAVVEGRHAAMLTAAGARRAAVVSIKEGGQIELVAIAAGTAMSTLAVSNTDDVIRVLASISDPLLLPAELVNSRPKLVAEVLRLRKGETELVDELGDAAGLFLAKRGGREALVVRMGETITLSPEAWARRGLLQQSLMHDLAARLKVIVLVDRTDLVQRRAFASRFGKKVVFVDSNEALGKALADARNRLVAIVGHVEGDHYVLRNAGNKTVVDVPISSIHRQIDETRSIALGLGCNVACAVPGSGPTTVIDALAVAKGLSLAAEVKTPLQFLDELASNLGPFHVDTDMFGRLRAVSTEHVRGSDRLAQGAGVTTRVLFARSPTTPLTASDVAAGAFTAVLLIPQLMLLFFLVGWLGPFLFGVGPRRTWQSTKENYAEFAGRPEDKIDEFLPWERPLLIILGPAALLGQLAIMLPIMLLNITLAFLSIPLAPFFMGRASRLLHADADWAVGTGWMGEMARRRIGATAIMLAGAIGAWMAGLWLFPGLSHWGEAAAAMAGLVLSWTIMMKLAWLSGLWLHFMSLAVGLSILPFQLVRFVASSLARLASLRKATS